MVTDREVLGAMVRALRERPAIGRITSFASLASVYAPFQTLTRLTLKLDDVRHPEYRHAPVDSPIFIVANPRSGTTLLHRLMSEDDENFASFTLAETIFPSISIQWLFGRLGEIDDRLLGGLLGKAARAFDARVFGSRWEDVHRLGLFETEEDETFFSYSLQSPTTMLLVPFPDAIAPHVALDRQSREKRDLMMDYYEGTIRRLIHRKGHDKRYLDKNVFHTTRIRTIAERFPDARFVYMMRHPYEALPSFLNMFHAAWKTHSPDIGRRSPEIRALLQVGYENYRYALELSRSLPKSQMTIRRYEDLVHDPKGFVEGLYEWLGHDMSDDFRARLETATSAQKLYERPYGHKLEDYGISEAEVATELAEVFEAFGYGD
jgi:omega-hydroxy-beta-dihydromenaquinone-9 sulfotransferase